MSKIVEVHERQPKIYGPYTENQFVHEHHPDAPVREYGATYEDGCTAVAIVGGPFWDTHTHAWKWVVQEADGFNYLVCDNYLGTKVEPAPETVEVPREELAALKARIEELEAGR